MRFCGLPFARRGNFAPPTSQPKIAHQNPSQHPASGTHPKPCHVLGHGARDAARSAACRRRSRLLWARLARPFAPRLLPRLSLAALGGCVRGLFSWLVFCANGARFRFYVHPLQTCITFRQRPAGSIYWLCKSQTTATAKDSWSQPWLFSPRTLRVRVEVGHPSRANPQESMPYIFVLSLAVGMGRRHFPAGSGRPVSFS